MDIPADLALIHEPTRLRVLGLLYRETDIGFTGLRDSLRLTAGNVASHVAKLEAAGLVTGRDALTRNGFEKRYQITEEGLSAFERYIEMLDGFVQTHRAETATAKENSAESDAGKKSLKLGKATWGFFAVGLLFVIGEAAQNYFAGASGSAYIGIGAAGGLVAGLAAFESILKVLARRGL